MTKNQSNKTVVTEASTAATSTIPLGQYTSQKDITITSLEVAKVIGKEHKNIMRDIRRYIQYMEEPNSVSIGKSKSEFIDCLLKSESSKNVSDSNRLTSEPVKNNRLNPNDFFKESYYTDQKGEIRPYYEVTKKGCELLAHKMNGQKGTIFTALYIERFHELEKQTNSQAFENSLQFLVSTVSKMQTDLTYLMHNIATQQPLLQTTIKPPTPRNTRWKSKTFKKLQQYIDYVNDKFNMSVKFNNAISSVLNRMDEDDCWDTDTWDNDAFETSIDACSSKYKELFDMEEEPLILDVVEYFPALKKKFTDALDSILDENGITSKCA